MGQAGSLRPSGTRPACLSIDTAYLWLRLCCFVGQALWSGWKPPRKHCSTSVSWRWGISARAWPLFPKAGGGRGWRLGWRWTCVAFLRQDTACRCAGGESLGAARCPSQAQGSNPANRRWAAGRDRPSSQPDLGLAQRLRLRGRPSASPQSVGSLVTPRAATLEPVPLLSGCFKRVSRG